MAASIRAVGTIASGVGTIAPGLPAGTVKGDWLWMFCESFRGEAVTASGWTSTVVIDSGDDAGANNTDTRLTVLQKIAVGSDATTTNDPGDHVIGRIIGITVDTYDPAAVFVTNVENTEDQSCAIDGVTTPVADCLVLCAVAGGIDFAAASTSQIGAMSNANLTSITERIDNGRTEGNGGVIGVVSGIKATAGAVGISTLTMSTATYKAMCCIAIPPLVPMNINKFKTMRAYGIAAVHDASVW